MLTWMHYSDKVLRDPKMSGRLCIIQCRLVLGVPDVQTAPSLHKTLDYPVMTTVRRQVERRVAVGGLDVDVDAVFQKQSVKN